MLIVDVGENLLLSLAFWRKSQITYNIVEAVELHTRN
ncbi:hypothetical protein B6N60_03772 [Richelia sinica FACHB-800]|uniref:Uncharacterized protein n=1 Tax=Richelia sinica FACHB-800 TaxID=1357546 RepID=A0A975Y6A1_9NOST|nr:hypothetical protein B6N60_03772 [Richelia sinica FACHB-800]